MTTKESVIQSQKNLIIPPLIEKLPFCVKVLLQRMGPEDYRVVYQIDRDVSAMLSKQIEEIKNIDSGVSILVDQAKDLLKRLIEMPDSTDTEALELIQEVKKKLEEMRR